MPSTDKVSITIIKKPAGNHNSHLLWTIETKSRKRS